LGYAYDYLGQALTDLGLYNEAESSFLLAKKEMKKYGDEYLMPELSFHTANLYLAQKNYNEAISVAKEGLVLSKKMQTIYGESEANRCLYEAYKATGKTALALEHFEKYTNLRDSLTKANIDSRFEQIQNEVELQKKEAQLTELRQKTERRNLIYLLGGLSLSLLASVFFARYFLKQTALLKAKNNKISEALVVGQAVGKQHLSMQLRDSLGSSISAINWTLDLLSTNKKSQEEQQMMESLRNQLMNSYEKINLLSKNILPEEIEKQGLEAALVSLLESTNRANGTNYVLTLPENFNGTEPKIEFEIYNIVQDLMLLDQKYGQLHEASILLELKERKVSLIFTFPKLGMGLKEDILMRNIEFRVESLSGKLSLEQINRDSLKLISEFKISY
jgi:signal transduction histidine kinase